MSNSNYKIEALVNEHCECGENPLWDEIEKKVYWVDIPNGFIFRFDPATGKHEKIYDGELVGGFTLQANGDLLIFGDHKISTLRRDGTLRVLTTDVPSETGRFNDVLADPEGRVYAGTLGADGTLSGGVFCVDLNGALKQLWDGTGCSNGMDFTPDLKKLYWTDSTSREIFRFDYDRATGALTNRELFYSAPEGAGIPDGLSVDLRGHIWSAHWGGASVRHFSPEGELIESIQLPVGAVSSCAFGGENLDELYITTADGQARKGQNVELNTPDGTLYRAHIGTVGRPPFRSRIGL